MIQDGVYVPLIEFDDGTKQLKLKVKPDKPMERVMSSGSIFCPLDSRSDHFVFTLVSYFVDHLKIINRRQTLPTLNGGCSHRWQGRLSVPSSVPIAFRLIADPQARQESGSLSSGSI